VLWTSSTSTFAMESSVHGSGRLALARGSVVDLRRLRDVGIDVDPATGLKVAANPFVPSESRSPVHAVGNEMEVVLQSGPSS